MQMMEGILLGFGQSAVPDFSSCLKDDEKEMQLIEDAISRLKSKEAKEVLKAIEDLGAALEALPKAIHECKGSIQEIRRLISAIESIKSPVSFAFHCGKNIVVNHVDIYNHVE